MTCSMGDVAVMTADSYVRARVDKATKDRAAQALGDMGLSISDAIRALLIRVAEERRLPFDIRASRLAGVSQGTNGNGSNHFNQLGMHSLEHYQLLHERFKPFVPHSRLGRRIVELKDEILETALVHHATNLRVFGGVARGEDVSGNLDLLVDLEDPGDIENLLDLQRALQELLGVRVDVVTEKALRPHIRSEVLAEACTI